jgi:hypothetical protein
MWNIYNKQNEVVDTAETHTTALRVIDSKFRTDRENAPFTCGLATQEN